MQCFYNRIHDDNKYVSYGRRLLYVNIKKTCMYGNAFGKTLIWMIC